MSGAGHDPGAGWRGDEPFTACAGCHPNIPREGSEEKVGNGHAREDIVNSLRTHTRFSQRY